MAFLHKLFNPGSSRHLKRLHRTVTKINEYEAAFARLSDAELAAKDSRAPGSS